MSLTKRYHASLTEKIDHLEEQVTVIKRAQNASAQKIYRLRQDIAKEYETMREQDEAYHTAQRKLGEARVELLDLNSGHQDRLPQPGANPEEE